MCFIVHSKHPNAKIAGRNIACYKRLAHWSIGLSSPVEDCIWCKSEELNIKGSIHKVGRLYKSTCADKIHVGFHSYSTKEKAIEYSREMDTSDVEIFISYIPKGARYYYNPNTEEYVSNELTITNKTINWQK